MKSEQASILGRLRRQTAQPSDSPSQRPPAPHSSLDNRPLKPRLLSAHGTTPRPCRVSPALTSVRLPRTQAPPLPKGCCPPPSTE